ncbi:hypothetical protein LAZ67_22000606 [Cordylochernes scorpioides]|uniref:RNA-directed DNA polymerase n=1 Tax=Cordylochernes scorpioides TaxID=51811 RepID=A0ABY6LSJ2_9ARAC|nr:hypothetical protein LAZ67_22000606 [Cordylochernes scorpioides]
MNAKIDCKKEIIKYDLTNNHDISNYELKKIKSVEDTVIPELSIRLIKASIEAEDGEYVIEENNRIIQTNGLRLARSLLTVTDRKTHIWITNPYPRPLKIMKDQTLAHGSLPAEVKFIEKLEQINNDEIQFQINKNLSPKEQEDLKQILSKYADLFSPRLGRTNLAKHRIDTEDAKPIKHKPYRVSPKERDIIKDQIDEMLKEGIIRPSSSPWSFPVILVKKRDGHFDPNAATYIHTDASNIGLGATLVQIICGEEKVISYLSRTLSKAEQNYSTTEKECLAVVWAISKLRPYLYGRHFKIITDHHALCWLKNLKDPTGRLARWALKIQEYDFDIIHKSGKKHMDADGLSRGPLPETDWVEDYERLFLNQIINEEDEFIENVKKSLKGSKRAITQNFKEENGCLYKKNPNPEGRAWLLVVPKKRRKEIMSEFHNHMLNGHLGVARTTYRLKNKYHWPSMLKDVSEFVKTCHLCQSRKGSNQSPSGLLQPIPPANYPFERIGIDFVGPLPSTKRRRKWIIVLTDYYTRGSQFTSNLMKEVMKMCKVKHCFTTSYHPQTNGLTERLNRTLINMISMYVNTDQKNWDEILPFVTHAYNTTIQETTGYSPFFLLFGREPMSLLDDDNIPIDNNMNDYDEYIENYLDKIARTRQVVINNTEKTQERMKRNYDKKHNERIYEPGHLVAVWTPVRKIGKCEKLLRKYFGPYRILKKLSNVNYLIEPKDNPGQDPLIVHVSRLKPYFERIDEEDSARRAEEVLKSRAQKAEESSESYIQDILSLCHQVNLRMEEDEIVSHIIKGILEEKYQVLVAKDIQTVDEILKFCRHLTTVKQRRIGRTKFARLSNVMPISCVDDSDDLAGLIRLIVREEIKKVFSSPEVVNPLRKVNALEQTVREEVSLNTGDHSLIRHRPYRVAPSERRLIQDEVNKMIENHIVKPSEGSWSSQVILVRKKDGTWRFSVDYRRLYKITKRDVYPLPNIDDALESLAGSSYFSPMDLRSGYWQTEVDEKDREKLAFITPDGLYEFRVMPFGLCNAPATFKRMIDSILGSLKWNMCLCYLDGLKVYAPTFEEHLRRLQLVLRNISELRSFLGLCSYYRRFIENFADKARSLHDLLKTEKQFCGDAAHEKAFEVHKTALIHEPVLRHFDESADTHLHTDASGHGIGAVLLQIQGGKERPIAYASRSLTKTENNYSTTEKECLAVVWSISKFRPYLFGRPLMVVSDHHSLCWLVEQKDPSGRLARWALKLQEFDVTVIYKSGRKHKDADFLSRSPLENDQPSAVMSLTNVDIEQTKDPALAKIIDNSNSGYTRKEFSIIDSILYKKNYSTTGIPWLMITPKHL